MIIIKPNIMFESIAIIINLNLSCFLVSKVQRWYKVCKLADFAGRDVKVCINGAR